MSTATTLESRLTDLSVPVKRKCTLRDAHALQVSSLFRSSQPSLSVAEAVEGVVFTATRRGGEVSRSLKAAIRPLA